jgi:UDP-2,3-diacylglucosamine pyrophosphatase LpxH
MNPIQRYDFKDIDQVLVVISDIEMGGGGHTDDFPHSDYLKELILSYNCAPFDQVPVTLVLNGDTFDLLKTSYLGKHPRHITTDVALGKMTRIAAAHPQFFEAIRCFLAYPKATREVRFIVGNHDFELLFDEVQSFIRSLCGPHQENLFFDGFELNVGRVHIEHGNQEDPLFRMDPNETFLKSENGPILNIPWCCVAILDVILPMKDILYFHDRLFPRNAVVELIPEMKELLVNAFWQYWTRDYWKGFFGNDPLKRLSWTMVKEVVARSVSQDADVCIGDAFEKRMQETDEYDLYLIGHLHRPTWSSFGNRKLLGTGCFRNEYMLKDKGRELEPINKVYAEVFLKDNRPLYSHLVEAPSPPAPEGYVPESIFDITPKLRAILAPQEKRDKDHADREAQEKREGNIDSIKEPSS